MKAFQLALAVLFVLCLAGFASAAESCTNTCAQAYKACQIGAGAECASTYVNCLNGCEGEHSLAKDLASLAFSVSNLLPILSLTMFILAGFVYGGSQVLGAETRARASVWATTLLIGGAIGLMLTASANMLVNAFTTPAFGDPDDSSDTGGENPGGDDPDCELNPELCTPPDSGEEGEDEDEESPTNIKESMESVCRQIKELVPVLSFMMFIIAGLVYGGGQFMGAETRARTTVWSMALLIGGIIGLTIAASARFLVKTFQGASISGDSALSDVGDVNC